MDKYPAYTTSETVMNGRPPLPPTGGSTSQVMFFGLCNSPATFQTMMNDILRDFISRGVIICYMDDILIYTETLAEHRQVTWEVLATLHHHKLFLKPEKCKFEWQEIDYLGLVISCGHIGMDPVKVQGVADWPALT